MKFMLLVFALLIGISCLTIPGVAQDTLTNKKVMELKNAGFSSDLIIAAIAKNTCKFQTDIPSIIVLKKAGVDEKVIVKMMEKDAPPLLLLHQLYPNKITLSKRSLNQARVFIL